MASVPIKEGDGGEMAGMNRRSAAEDYKDHMPIMLCLMRHCAIVSYHWDKVTGWCKIAFVWWHERSQWLGGYRVLPWAGFWPSVVSNIAGGVVAGSIVGLFLWRLQVGAEARVTENQYENQYLALEAKIKDVLLSKDVTNVSSARESELSTSQKLHGELSGIPLQIWKPHLPQYTDRLEKLSDFLKNRSEFVRAAETLDLALSQAIRAYNHAKQIAMINDTSDHAYYVALTNGLSPPEAVKWIGMSMNDQVLRRFENSFSEVFSDDVVKSSTQLYLETRDTLAMTLDNLRIAFLGGDA